MPALQGPPLRSRFASIPAALSYWAARTPNAPALTSRGIAQTYAELAAAVCGLAGVLRSRGTAVGDRVMLAGDNTLAWVHAYLAVLSIGAIAVPANNRLSPAQFAALADLMHASVVLADRQPASLAAACPSWRLLHAADLEAAVPNSPGTDGSLAQLGERPAVVSFTSGTTGTPKGVVLTHQALADAATVFAEVIGTGQGASTLVMAPLFHNTGLVDQLGHMLVVGGRTDLLRRFHAGEAIAAARERPATFVTAVPSVLRLLMINDGAGAVFAPATDVLYGGSPMPPAWTRELAARWPHLRLHHGYGLTEFSSAAIRGGWLRTGDLARCDGGLLYLCGRVDDVINRGGEKIHPADVETEIAALPGVGQVCVFGAPDPVLQQRVVAVIEPRPGAAFDAGHARAALAARLADYAIPADFLVVGNLPRTASGKLDRRLITASFGCQRAPHPTEES